MKNFYRNLQKAHSEIGDKVKQLMEHDLLKGIDKWKDIMTDIRTQFVEQEKYIGNRIHMRTWIIHWEIQIYKVFYPSLLKNIFIFQLCFYFFC